MNRRAFVWSSAALAAAPLILSDVLLAQRSIGAASSYFPTNSDWSWMFLRAAGGGDVNELHQACSRMSTPFLGPVLLQQVR